MKLTRFDANPILTPRPGLDWEADGTFNPAAIIVDNKVNLIYRAVDANRISRLGYAQSLNGTEISYRSEHPVIEPSAEWEEFGCEDPRVTQNDGTYYLTYTAFSRQGPRIALASTKDFQHFTKHGLVGPNRDDKDCVLFPGEVNGKIAMLHRLESEIQIASFENIDALCNSQEFWRKYMTHYSDYRILGPKYLWDEWKIGAGATPLKTDRGWLLIYHGVSVHRIYRAGAVLLDLDEPSKVLARTREPILEPQMDFEKRGVVPNVVFPEGAVVQDGNLVIYYGGADRVSCVAKAPIDSFLDDLERES